MSRIKVNNISPFSGDAVVITNLVISGSESSFSGSLYGTSSWALNTVSASYAVSASYEINIETSSSYAETASLAFTASSADSFTVRNELTALNSTTFGVSLTDTHEITGSTDITGSLTVNNSAAVTEDTLVPFSSSISSRVTDLESFSSSLDITFATDAQLNAATASLSGSIALLSSSYLDSSASLSTRTTDLESTASVLTVASASLSSSVASLSNDFSAFSSSYTTGSFTGSFTGNGSGLTDIPASGIVGLNLSQIASGNVTASINPVTGFTVNTNTNITGSLLVSAGITGSLQGTASWAVQAFTASYADAFTVANNAVVSGSLTVLQNLTVFGSASINYITQSNLDIATNIITVNTDTPGVRFGGLAVADSGSVPRVSGSWLFDSVQDRWLFVHQSAAGASVTSSIGIMGPETYNNLGNETQITLNRLTKGYEGATGEHIGDSQISDDGTTVSIPGNLTVTGSIIGLINSASYALSSSYTLSATSASSAINAATASYVLNAVSSSFATTSSFATSASFATTSSFAATASSADSFLVRQNATASNVLVNNTLTAQTLVVQTVTSSIIYSSGSNIFGNQLTNVQQMTGSLRVTGSGNHYIVGGNVGINTISPTAGYRLDVKGLVQFGNDTNANVVRMGDLDANSTYIQSVSTGGIARNLVLYNSAETMRITSTSLVGINATAPAARLTISGSNTEGILLINSPASGSILAVSGSGNVGIATQPFASRLQVSGSNTQGLLLVSSPVSASILVVSGSGNVGINTQPFAASLQVSGSNTQGLLLVSSPVSASILVVSGSGLVGINTASPTTALDVNGTGRFTTVVETSTRTLKDNIQPYITEVTTFNQLEPVSFTWKDTGKKDIGLIAEDVEQLFPEFVHKTNEGEIQGINYGKLTVALINMVKDQQQRIELLEQQVKKLIS